ncbi:MAG: M28 family peptidase [Vicingaceae bacterium]|nr:M28 family peptidase [Vicingaceae bacterium]
MKKQLILFIILSLICLSFFGNNSADTIKIKAHLTAITKTQQPRNHKNIDQLNKTASYIYNEFSHYADTVYFQNYTANGKEYKNVICVFGINNPKTIVVGAHYDVCDNQEGADDNASGTVGLLELARLLKGKVLNHRIEMVAYTLEEPPYFRTNKMGSYIHAKSLVDNKTDVYGMVCLEMIGYFDDAKKSQDYPIGILSWIYGNKGNYITLVNKFGKGKFARKFNKGFKKKKLINTKKFVAPKWLPGIDFSDHLNYWQFGFSSLMITDTAFYRNKNYHKKTDKMETLNITKMAQVIDSTLETLINLE